MCPIVPIVVQKAATRFKLIPMCPIVPIVVIKVQPTANS